MKFALVQDNPTVGAVDENAALLRQARQKAAELGAHVVVASELYLTGYPPEDLVLKSSFTTHVRDVAEQLVAETKDGGPALIFGLPWVENGLLYNSVMVADGGQFSVRHKRHLPNYAVFDEKRLFASGGLSDPVDLRGVRIGLPICEDIWFPDICQNLKSKGAEMLISPNGSPFERGKHSARTRHASQRCIETGLPLIYVNQFGGQDELVFDGRSFAMDSQGYTCVRMPAWQSDMAIIETLESDAGLSFVRPSDTTQLAIADDMEKDAEDDYSELADVYAAACLGLSDYVKKNRFPGVLIGLSGGIDSAICAAIAVDAIGADRVHCLMLPSKYTSQESLDDAIECATALGIRLDNVSIADMVDAADKTLAPIFDGRDADITEENIQSRTRGLLLMAVSNKLGAMVVTTGNKSEVSVGYATLYGDMNGGYNPIKDIYKMDVFALSDWRNKNTLSHGLGPKGEVIPQRIIDKPPSAELRSDQKDEDSLPPYEILDRILSALVEEEASFDEIVARGYDADTVKRIEHLLYVSEYKRRQSAPGPKIGFRNFGRDRRYPITNGFRDARLKG